jgi:predicted choloylglycine hydrolase
MKRALCVLAVIAIAIVATFRGTAPSAARIYDEYDRQFRDYLDQAIRLVGRETIKVERLSDEYTIPQKLTIQGTPYEIGLTIGHIGRQAKAPLPLLAQNRHALNEKVAELYRRIYPQDLELVRGVADAYEQKANDIDLMLFASEFTPSLWMGLFKHKRFYEATDFGKHGEPRPNHHCSAVSYFVGGRHLVGRHFDHASDRPTFFASVEMTGTYKVMGHTPYDITGELVDGMNEKGLSLCVTSNNDGKYATAEPYPEEPAIVMWHMMLIVMQTCANVDEALELLRSVRVWFPEEGNHWLLADTSGKSVVVEWTPGDHKLVVFDKPGPYELLTNAALQEGEDFLVENCPRYRKAKPLLENSVRNAAEMLEVMNAMRITGGPGRSLWTTIMDLNGRTFEVRYFKEFERKYKFGF